MKIKHNQFLEDFFKTLEEKPIKIDFSVQSDSLELFIKNQCNKFGFTVQPTWTTDGKLDSIAVLYAKLIGDLKNKEELYYALQQLDWKIQTIEAPTSLETTESNLKKLAM